VIAGYLTLWIQLLSGDGSNLKSYCIVELLSLIDWVKHIVQLVIETEVEIEWEYVSEIV
jgi:hypothetical protein